MERSQTFSACSIVSTIAVLFLSSCSTKIVDPSDARYNARNFVFHDYVDFVKNNKTSTFFPCQAYFPVLIPLGTTKEEVALIFSSAEKISPSPHDAQAISYLFRSEEFWRTLITSVIVTYDKADKVSDVTCTEGYKAL